MQLVAKGVGLSDEPSVRCTKDLECVPYVRYTKDMKSAAFIQTVAQAYRINEKSLVHFARLLKEAGLLSTGGRGRSAPDMTPLDAARTTIALLATDKPTQAVEAVEKFGNLTHNFTYNTGEVPDFAKDEKFATSFEDALTEIFSKDGPKWGLCREIEIAWEDERAIMEFHNGRVVFDGTAEDVRRIGESQSDSGIRTSRKLALAEMMNVALPLNYDDPYGPIPAEGELY